jgi:DNA replication factor Dna2
MAEDPTTAVTTTTTTSTKQQRRTRTSPTQDCIEWDAAGQLQDPRKLADPTFREERPSPADSAVDVLTPVVPRKRRRRPLMNVTVGGKAEEEEQHVDPRTNSSLSASSSAMMMVTSTSSSSGGAEESSATSSSSFHRMLFLKSSQKMAENRPVYANSRAAVPPEGTENEELSKASSPPPPAQVDEAMDDSSNFIRNRSTHDDDDEDDFFDDISDEQLARIDAIAINSSQSAHHHQHRGGGAISPMMAVVGSQPHRPAVAQSSSQQSHQTPQPLETLQQPLDHCYVPTRSQGTSHNILQQPIPLQPLNHPPPTTQHDAPPPKNVDDDDDDSFFGDLPDFDVDEAAKTAWAKRDHNMQQLLTTAAAPAAVAAATTTTKNKTTTSPGALFDDDWTEEDMAAMEADASLTFTRYRVLAVAVDDMMMNAFTKQLTLAIWTTDMLREEEQALRNRHHPSYERSTATTANEEKRNNKEWPAAGVLYLVGSWSQTNVRAGDTIHLCSLLGRTNTKVLPKSVGGSGDDNDDLVMIVHPDLLLAPTIISEGVACPRRAVLRSRLGSTGLTSTCHWLILHSV